MYFRLIDTHKNRRNIKSLSRRKDFTMRKSLLLAVLAIACIASFAFANNSDRAAVTAVARNYMDAYYTADAAKMQRSLHPNFHKRTLLRNSQELREDNVETMLEGVRSGSGKTFKENERVKSIQVLDMYKDAATVKVVTARWVDYMLITRQNGDWRVLDVVLQYTR